MKKIYIAGKITGLPDYKEIFAAKEKELTEQGYTVMNPAVLPYPGFEHHEYMHVCKAMIDICDIVVMMDNWTESEGAKQELIYALRNNKTVQFNEKTEKMLNWLLDKYGKERMGETTLKARYATTMMIGRFGQ